MFNGVRRAVCTLGAMAVAASTGCLGAPDPDGAEEATVQSVAALQDELAALPNHTVGAGSVFAPIAAQPGYPEGVVVVGDKVFVSGPAAFGTAGSGPSAVSIFDRETGAALGTIPLHGEDLAQEHALSCITRRTPSGGCTRSARSSTSSG